MFSDNDSKKVNQGKISPFTSFYFNLPLILQDYHNKQVVQLEAERHTLQEEFLFQCMDQDEQLTEVSILNCRADCRAGLTMSHNVTNVTKS